MTTPESVTRGTRLALPKRGEVWLAVIAARLLATRSPHRIRRILSWLYREAHPATYRQVKAARDSVTAVSMMCAAREGCVQRSLATILLCRLHGRSATWCVGVRRMAPFGAHAWVEVAGEPVGEPYPPDYFRTLFTLP